MSLLKETNAPLPFPQLTPIDLLFTIHTHVDLQSSARYTDTVM